MIVGSKVVCVDDVFPVGVLKFYAQLPVKGRTYTVRSLGIGRGQFLNARHTPALSNQPGDSDGEVLVRLVELRNGPDPMQTAHHELGFKAERFRELEPPAQEEQRGREGAQQPKEGELASV
jgi:hypothetical protein